jgi:hypothetical protein
MKTNQPETVLRSSLNLLFAISITLFVCSCNSGNKGVQVSGDAQKPAVSNGNESTSYNPMYWIEGAAERRKGDLTSSEADAMVEDIYTKGWRGLTYWGADRDDAKMNYFFKSQFLEKQEWAAFKSDGLSPIVKAAHKKGVKVMINMEGVNPYHWEKNKWTAENIRSVADDLATDSVDAVFEECFEVKPEVFTSLARELKARGVNYISGTDPMLLREANFAALWPETGTIDIYNYYLKRDKIFNIATLTQHGSLGYGWAKYWGKPTSLISPVNRNWGIPGDYSQAVIPYLCMIRALQFRLDNFIIFGGLNTFDPIATQSWIKEYVDKQEKERPVLNIVVLLKKQSEYSGSETGDKGWNRLFNSGDAITSGGMNAGYNIIVSDKVIPADAYWVYASGGNNDNLPSDVVDLFSTDKPVFIQCGSSIPNGKSISPGWKTVLEKCGIDGTKTFGYGERESQQEVSLPPNQESDLPYTGYYKDVYLRFTGSDVQRGMDLRSGTVIPKEAISGTVYCAPNKTYGRGPFITGKDKKFVVTANTLNWEAAYPVSDLLSGSGILPSSNVWGIAGSNVTALLAIETTELEIKIPGLSEGARIHVVIWDNKKNKKSEEIAIYKPPFKQFLKEYDFIIIDKVN